MLILISSGYVLTAYALALLGTWNLPGKGNYDVVRAHGMMTNGVVDSVRPDEGLDDWHWMVVHFTFSHDGHSYSSTACTEGSLNPGDCIRICYLHDQAVLADYPPLDTEPVAETLFFSAVFAVLLLPLYILFCLPFGMWLLVSMIKILGPLLDMRRGGPPPTRWWRRTAPSLARHEITPSFPLHSRRRGFSRDSSRLRPTNSGRLL
jgi:hypothetical protein